MPPSSGKIANVATITPRVRSTNVLTWPKKGCQLSVCKQAGVPWVTPHVLRHTFASQLAMAGVSLYKISQWLGHSDFKTTQIYAHLQASDDDIDRL